jgi:hypothetical protein
MEDISAAWLYPIILVAGALQAWGPPMNGALRRSLRTKPQGLSYCWAGGLAKVIEATARFMRPAGHAAAR